MARPTNDQLFIKKIRKEEKKRIEKNIDFFEKLNEDMPAILDEMLMYAMGQSETMDDKRYRACTSLYDKWVEMSALLTKAADKVEEEISPKEKVQGTDGNVMRVSFSQTAVKQD